MRRTRAAGAAAALLIGLSLAACSGGDEGAPITEETTTAEEAPEEAVDRTADLADIDAAITTATERSLGDLEIATTIVDPRGDAGSAEAQQAITICQAGVELLGDAATLDALS